MRLFTALELDRTVVAAADALILDLRQRAARLAPRARITWISDERMHLTIRFIGNVDEEKTRAIRELLEPRLAVPAFDATFAGMGAFPRGRPPQVLWVGVAGGLDGLQQVEREVTRRLEAAGVPPEPRAYSPHLTLARVREPGGLKPAALFDGLGDTTLGTTRVEAITLFESRLSPKGPTYLPLHRTPLGGA